MCFPENFTASNALTPGPGDPDNVAENYRTMRLPCILARLNHFMDIFMISFEN